MQEPDLTPETPPENTASQVANAIVQASPASSQRPLLPRLTLVCTIIFLATCILNVLFLYVFPFGSGGAALGQASADYWNLSVGPLGIAALAFGTGYTVLLGVYFFSRYPKRWLKVLSGAGLLVLVFIYGSLVVEYASAMLGQ